MRLLNTKTLKLEEFFSSEVPYYAILSHTWGKGEVTFQDMQMSLAEQKEGYSKLQGCCGRAVQDGYEYVWIDTCCIDKTSSAELSEAINSMYKWYQEADICYAYLIDVPTADENKIAICYRYSDEEQGTLWSSKWFTRGWTLQELIAPRVVEFYAADWTEIGTKSSLCEELTMITGINIRVLEGEDPSICNVAERLSWAASRQTSRVEDAAYCLLGIFKVHMPLLYGEGESSLVRLQEQILKTTEDYTVLARGGSSDFRQYWNRSRGALAQHLVEFKVGRLSNGKYSELELDKNKTTETLLRKASRDVMADITPTLTAKGLHICLPLFKVSEVEYLAYLYCRLRTTGELMCMPLTPTNLEGSRYERKDVTLEGHQDYKFLPATNLTLFRLVTIFIQQDHQEGIRRTLGIRDFCEYVFRVDATTFSEQCTVLTSWGNNTKVLPWTTEILGIRNSSPSRFRALFVLQSGDNFMVKFGIKSGKLWCCIILEEEVMTSTSLGYFFQHLDAWHTKANFVPDLLVDRAIRMLQSKLGRVFVSIRKTSLRLDVSVCIKAV